MLNSLARTALKLTLPGVPDTYQGTEFWDLSLVDPDNRRPVDYPALEAGLADDAPPAELLRSWTDGRIKQRVTARLLADRAASPLLYAEGDYRPISVSGDRGGPLLAFARGQGSDALVTVVPRLAARMAGDGALPLGSEFWGDARVAIPSGRWRNALTGEEIEAGPDGVGAGELFATLPIAVLRTSGMRIPA
jgi:(1->4)-alpha-D-glucan 1-alpha-D-glucosylmutase